MIKKLVWLFLLLTAPAFSQAVGGGGVPGPSSGGGGGGGAQTITGPTYSQSDTTIVATWYTSGASSTALKCGAKAAVDNNVAPNSIFHEAIVAGLTPVTQYSCSVTSGSTTSTPQNVTTNAAQTKTPITAMTLGAISTNSSATGDTFYNVVSNDNKTYTVIDDTSGLDNATSSNMALDLFTNETNFTGTTVNALSNFGTQGQTSGTDGPTGEPLNNKGNGLFGMLGNLYYFATRNQYVGAFGAATQLAWYGNWMLSPDHGKTWNTWQNPPGFQANGTLPNPLGSFMYATKLYGWCVPTRYAMDDGTLGYLTVGNRIDGADAYVYISCTDGLWNNSSNLYLTRIPRVQFAAQNPGAIQYWVGPASPASTDFVNDANWSSSAASATAIYSAANQTSSQDMVYIPTLNYYLLTEWYQPNPAVTTTSNWQILSGPTPAGPWTQIGSAAWTTQGYYNPVVAHRTAATVANLTNAQLTFLYSGYGGSYYHPTYSPVYLNPSLIDATAPAVFAGSAAHSLKASYAGPLIRIQRASDSTQTDVGQTAAGLLNQATITTFCSGTTCNIAKLYDQSGNGHDAVQATFANMPIIYASAAVITAGVNGRPAIKWDNTQRFLTSTFTPTGQVFEGLGVGVLAAAGGSGYAGFATLTDGTHSGGSTLGLVDVLDENSTNNSLAAGFNTCGLPSIAMTFGTQFLADSYSNLANPGSCSVGVNGGSFSTNSNATSVTVTATQLLIGSDEPTSTYFWNGTISDMVLYQATLTTGQRSLAHSLESAFYGTP